MTDSFEQQAARRIVKFARQVLAGEISGGLMLSTAVDRARKDDATARMADDDE